MYWKNAFGCSSKSEGNRNTVGGFGSNSCPLISGNFIHNSINNTQASFETSVYKQTGTLSDKIRSLGVNHLPSIIQVSRLGRKPTAMLKLKMDIMTLPSR